MHHIMFLVPLAKLKDSFNDGTSMAYTVLH